MPEKRSVAIILVNYKNNEDTVRCLHSVKNSSGVELPFVVVVDNAAHSAELERELYFYPRLKVLYSKENLGFGKANNLGINWAVTQTDCNFVFILNNDTVLEEATVADLVKAFPDDSSTVMVTPKILTLEPQPRVWYGGGFFDFRRMSVRINHLNQPDRVLPDQPVEFASGCAMLFRARYFKNHAGFDPKIFMYDEDVELCLRLKREGQKILFVGSAVVYHKCQGSQQRQKAKQQKINQLHPYSPGIKFYLSNTIPNRYYIADKYFQGWQNAKIKTCLTIYWFCKTAQYLLYGRLRLAFFAVSKVIAN